MFRDAPCSGFYRALNNWPAREKQWNRIWNKRAVRKIIPGVGGKSVSVGHWHCSSRPLEAAKRRLETRHLQIREMPRPKASVMETRQSASQVNPSNIGLSADSVLDSQNLRSPHLLKTKPVVWSEEM